MTVAVDKTKCIGCGACVMECSLEAIDLVDGLAVPDPKKCKDLGACVKVCPTNALSLSIQHQANPEQISPEAGSKFNLKDPCLILSVIIPKVMRRRRSVLKCLPLQAGMCGVEFGLSLNTATEGLPLYPGSCWVKAVSLLIHWAANFAE